MEKRKHPRFVCEFTVSFEGVQATGSGTVSNLSMGGCSLQSDTDLHTGAHMELRISPPDHESPIRVGLAVVLRVKGRKSGVEFINMEPEEQERLRRCVNTLETRQSR